MFHSVILNTSEPVNQQIYRILRKAIVTSQLLPGAPLSEKEISSQFNVSRQPVRESFIKLAEAGLVQILPQRGTFVTRISIKRVIDGQFIREAVEMAIVRRAAQQITALHSEKLANNLQEQERALADKNDRLFLEKDDEFHQILMSIIDCPMAWDTIENIKAMVDRVRFLSLEVVTPPEVLIEQHKNIFDALKKHDADGAEKALKEHLSAILDSIKVVSSQNTDWFIE